MSLICGNIELSPFNRSFYARDFYFPAHTQLYTVVVRDQRRNGAFFFGPALDRLNGDTPYGAVSFLAPRNETADNRGANSEAGLTKANAQEASTMAEKHYADNSPSAQIPQDENLI